MPLLPHPHPLPPPKPTPLHPLPKPLQPPPCLHPPQSIHIGPKALGSKKVKHAPHIRHHPQQRRCQKPIRDRDLLPTAPIAKHGLRLRPGQAVARERQGLVAVGRVVGLEQGGGAEGPDVGGVDDLQRGGGADVVAPGGGDEFAGEAPFEVVEEEDGAEDGVGHGVRAVVGFVVGASAGTVPVTGGGGGGGGGAGLARFAEEVFLDLVFGAEVRDGGGVAVAFGAAAALDGGVDEAAHVGGDGGVDERGALGDFVLARQLHAEDGPGGGAGGQGGEDGGRVVEVAGDERDAGGEGGEFLRRGGGRAPGEGVDGVRGGRVGRVREEGADHGAALFAGGAGDEDGFGHFLWSSSFRGAVV